MQEHDDAQLVDAYIAVKLQIRDLEAKQDQLRAQIEECSRRNRVDRLNGRVGAVSVRRSRGLKVVDRDAVLGALDGRGLLRPFVVIKPTTLYRIAETAPDLREQLGSAVKEIDQATVTILK